MLTSLSAIIAFGLIAFVLTMILYPFYISLLRRLKYGKTIREESATGDGAPIFQSLHAHKAWTPTMWWWVLLVMMIIMIWLSFLAQYLDITNYSLRNREESYILLFWFFSMWILWLIDDILNIKNMWRIKWLSAKAKTLTMILFAWFISYWFYIKLGVDYINIRPLNLLRDGNVTLSLWRIFPLLVFFSTIAITNAINITDWLDGLVWWMMIIVLFVLSVATFMRQTYIATTVIVVIIAVLLWFLWFNIFPAKIFLWDSGAFALGWVISSLLFLLNMRMSIIIPFLILFLPCIVEIASSALQMLSKKIRKRKLFAVAPLHHLFEHYWHHEASIVMKFWLTQAVLWALVVIMILYQFSTWILS